MCEPQTRMAAGFAAMERTGIEPVTFGLQIRSESKHRVTPDRESASAMVRCHATTPGVTARVDQTLTSTAHQGPHG